MRLINTKLDTTIIAIVDKCLVTTSSRGRVINKAYDSVGSDNMEDVRQKTGFHDGLQYKTLYIKKPKANQIKVDIITEATADQHLTTTSAQRRVANRARDSRRLQQNIRARVAKFVQNADTQE